MAMGIGQIVSGGMSTRTVERKGNTTRTVIHLRDHEGNDRGTISYTQRGGTNGLKKKRLPYNFKEISSQLMRTRTAEAASRVAGKARRRVSQLLRNKKNSEYDEAEIEAALLHAEQMERVAEKRKKHLQVEERAEREIGAEETEDALRGKEDGSRRTTEAKNPADTVATSGEDEDRDETGLPREIREEEIEKMMRELEQMLSGMEKIEESAKEFSESMDEMTEAISGDMEPRDLEEMKKKHRAEEQRDIVRADMKYLKAMFDKLAREKAQAKAAAALSGVIASLPAESSAPAKGVSAPGGGSGPGAHTGGGAVPTTDMPSTPIQGGMIDVQA